MSSLLYHDGNRVLQDEFGSRPLADRACITGISMKPNLVAKPPVLAIGFTKSKSTATAPSSTSSRKAGACSQQWRRLDHKGNRD